MVPAAAAPSPLAAADQVVVLPRVSWETYQRLLTDDEDRRVPRITYDRGVLEIVSPSPQHEQDAETIKFITALFAAESGISVAWYGSTTFRRPDREQGFEPDASFYIAHERQMRGRASIDLMVDPPPDLVLEVDASRSSLRKLQMLAGFGVPEVWRKDGDRIRIFLLEGGGYREATQSQALPGLSAELIARLLVARRTLPSPEWIQLVLRSAAQLRAQGSA
jgi:Uma2 family endonuclease